MPDREEHRLPVQSASTEEKSLPDSPKRTIANRRKSVGVTREADPGRLKAADYLGRRWLSRH